MDRYKPPAAMTTSWFLKQSKPSSDGYIARAYLGPDKEPEPRTEAEFSELMDGLRRWATLHWPHIDTGRLQDFRRAEFSLVACIPARAFPDERAEREWWQVAHKADDALNEIKIQLCEIIANKAEKKHESHSGGGGWGGLAARAVALAVRVPEFAAEMEFAVNYLASDPPSSLTKSRIILEKMLIMLYRGSMNKDPKRPMIVDMLADKAFTATIPRRFLARMTAVRDMSNLGPHGKPVEVTDALRVLSDLLELLDWYVSIK